MIFGIGIDIVDIVRIRRVISEYGDKFLNHIYTEEEIKYCESFKDKKDSKYLHYAARFAAKEAFSKAIGTGIGAECKLKEISIVNNEKGQPFIYLSGKLNTKL